MVDYIRNLCFCGGPTQDDYSELNAWFKKIHYFRCDGGIDGTSLKLLRDAFGPAMGAETMQGRSLLKRRGYAGDFEIIDDIYRQTISSNESLKRWDEYFHSQAAAKAVRNRKTYFISLLESLLRNHDSIRPLRILNVASGPCRDLAEFLSKHEDPAINFTCIDIDPDAIAFAKRLCAPWKDKIAFVQGNALRLRLPDEFDLVWSAGLFDYFDDRGFVLLLKRLLTFADKHHSQIVIGNFTEPNPSISYQAFGDWLLTHRRQDLLKELASRCRIASDQIEIDSEPEGVNLFLRIRQTA